MDARQKIIIHKALNTSNDLRASDAARIGLALRLLGHDDIAIDLENAVGHTQWAADNLAQVEAAAPQVEGAFGVMLAELTPAVAEAEAHVARYREDWWEIKAKIDAIAADVER